MEGSYKYSQWATPRVISAPPDWVIDAERQNRGEIPAPHVLPRKERSTVSPERFQQAIGDLAAWNPLPDSLGMWRMSLEDHRPEQAAAASQNLEAVNTQSRGISSSSLPHSTILPKPAVPKKARKVTFAAQPSQSPSPQKRKRSSIQEPSQNLPKASRKSLLQPSTPRRRRGGVVDQMDIDGDDKEDEDTARAQPPPRRTSNRLKKRAARRVGPTFYI
ncbi:hypothetical protein EPUS_04040 [Endocarpon pusillum Z07020]|uniref:Uncharacterized protein n=1 Tax=Endocarpon pusillum (strain Z07020 / HMAS-L-300199) TaxID=1263415 RepID=U1G7L3_ENDPU|nr:uncharacterized protein EPUS_04040 [Endocarpon pusillum Z07020]ERF73417.1 hypothetical protein EPUS_04040 [Endocarpon pusillum Z07020]